MLIVACYVHFAPAKQVKQFIAEAAKTESRALQVCLLDAAIGTCTYYVKQYAVNVRTISRTNDVTLLKADLFFCLQTFKKHYSEELQLNAAFNRFVSEYAQAYNGENTLQHQLGVKNKHMKALREFTVHVMVSLAKLPSRHSYAKSIGGFYFNCIPHIAFAME